MKKFLEVKQIKQSAIAKALQISKATMSYKVKHNAFTLSDIKILRIAGILNLEDIDKITKCKEN